jgi:hypothetical protein
MIGGTIVSGILGGNAAKMAQKKLDEIIALPGTDIGKSQGEAISAYQQNAAGAKDVAGDVNQFAMDEQARLLEGSMPGWQNMQGQRMANAQSMLAGEIPQDVADAIYRGGANRAVAGGYGGSGRMKNLTARDFGLTSLDLMGRGQDFSQGIVGSTPLARLIGTDSILNVSGKDALGLRSGERTEKMGAMRDRAIAPGKTAAAAQSAQKISDQMTSLAGAALGGGLGR